uniref:ERCC excision repair 1, endonuclease non-catalytic subunit n=1 Tax=Aquila chrysaetos chrysaetos TaxID=223781 RepID=A0A663FHJ4_AQUCH
GGGEPVGAPWEARGGVSVWEAPRRPAPPASSPSGPVAFQTLWAPPPAPPAEYVVQQSVPTACPGTTEPVPVPVSTTGAPPRPPQPPEPGGGGPPGGAVPGGGGGSAGDVPPLPVLKPGAKSSSIIVSPRQRGNPVLKFIRNVPWEFGDVVPDYVLGQSTCALFLSLRYHHLNPGYIHDRLRHLGRSYGLQLLLLQVDVKDPHQALKEPGEDLHPGRLHPPGSLEPRGGRQVPGDLQGLRAEATRLAEGACGAGFPLPDDRLPDQHQVGEQDGCAESPHHLWVVGSRGGCLQGRSVPLPRCRTPEGQAALRCPARTLPQGPQMNHRPQNLWFYNKWHLSVTRLRGGGDMGVTPAVPPCVAASSFWAPLALREPPRHLGGVPACDPSPHQVPPSPGWTPQVPPESPSLSSSSSWLAVDWAPGRSLARWEGARSSR